MNVARGPGADVLHAPLGGRTGPPHTASPLLADEYLRIRSASEALAAPLSPEDCQVQSMPDASPAKWHLAHTTWFFETFLLEPHEPAFAPFDARFRVLYNSYYQGIGAQHPRAGRGLVSRPTLAEVLRWRTQVDERMLALLARRDDLAPLVTLGLNHEQQHQELLLTDIQHALSLGSADAAYAAPAPAARSEAPPAPLRWTGRDAGLFDMGYRADDGVFAFDNESPRHRVWLNDFAIASRPVTCGEFLAFMDDGGYRRPALWLAAGWDWACAGVGGAGGTPRAAPFYWRDTGAEGWRRHSLHGDVAVDPHAPVCHLSYFEADAYARWAGARLPTEAEWECTARALRDPAAALAAGNFADGGALRPLPQGTPSSPGEPAQLYGDVWEWTQSSYAPYPGFRPAAGAVGEYNGKFMCQQMVLRGGSCATPAGHVRAGYRNFFAPQAQWQFSGLRLARDA